MRGLEVICGALTQEAQFFVGDELKQALVVSRFSILRNVNAQ